MQIFFLRRILQDLEKKTFTEFLFTFKKFLPAHRISIHLKFPFRGFSKEKKDVWFCRMSPKGLLWFCGVPQEVSSLHSNVASFVRESFVRDCEITSGPNGKAVVDT